MVKNASLLAERLKTIRKDHKLTQEKMADLLSLKVSAYVNYENGNREPDLTTLNSIADKLNVSLDYLLGRVDNPDIAILSNLPEELKMEGIKAIFVVKEAVKTGLTAAEIHELLTFAQSVKAKKVDDDTTVS